MNNEPEERILIEKGIYRLAIMENEVLNNKVVELARKASEKGSVLIIINWVQHGQNLLNMFAPEDKAELIHAELHTTGRFKEVIDDFKQEKIKILIASPVFDEGMDMPNIRTLILASGGKSSIQLLQRIGRGLRKKKEDNYLDVHDFVSASHKYILNHALARLKEYEKQGFPVEQLDNG